MSQVLEFERVEADRRVAPDQRLAIGVIVTGLISVFGAAALQPAAPQQAHAAWDVVAEIGAILFFGLAFFGAYALLEGRTRWGYTGLAAASYVQLVLVVGCPVSGHHAFRAWWAGQLALALAFTAVSTVAAAITRPGSRRADS